MVLVRGKEAAAGILSLAYALHGIFLHYRYDI